MKLDENSLEEYEYHTASVTGLYTKGGGTYLTTYLWAFLYQGDQKYGIVFTDGSEHFVLLGQTFVDTNPAIYPSPKANGVTVETSDMQNTVNGHGDEW